MGNILIQKPYESLSIFSGVSLILFALEDSEIIFEKEKPFVAFQGKKISLGFSSDEELLNSLAVGVGKLLKPDKSLEIFLFLWKDKSGFRIESDAVGSKALEQIAGILALYRAEPPEKPKTKRGKK